MPKLLLLHGLPGSGKSTRAKEIVNQGGWVRVNRDLLRDMLHNNKWSGSNEDITFSAEMAMARVALVHGSNVVVDDTNLNERVQDQWRSLAEDMQAVCDVKFEIEHIKTPVAECIRRDAAREKSVGRDRIVEMALKAHLFPVPDKGFVLCDLDGTLCDLSHRLKYASGPEKNWKKFFEGIPGDRLRTSTLNILQQARSRGHQIFFVSARPDTYRDVTIEWLKEHLPVDFHYEGLIMRRGSDKREDSLIKQQMYELCFSHYPVEFVVDDRPRVIRMWQAQGLHVIDVGNGEEF